METVNTNNLNILDEENKHILAEIELNRNYEDVICDPHHTTLIFHPWSSDEEGAMIRGRKGVGRSFQEIKMKIITKDGKS